MDSNEIKVVVLTMVSIAVASIIVIIFQFKTFLVAADLAPNSEYAKNFGFLILIALFVERATAVLVSIQGSAKLIEAQNEFKLAQAKFYETRALREEKSSSVDATSIDKAITELGKKALVLKTVETEERFKASIPSVVIGFLIAGAGVHAVGLFLNNVAATTAKLTSLFHIADIVLTGLLIGGGAEGIRAIWRETAKAFDKNELLRR
jgi:hypothetical protein